MGVLICVFGKGVYCVVTIFPALAVILAVFEVSLIYKMIRGGGYVAGVIDQLVFYPMAVVLVIIEAAVIDQIPLEVKKSSLTGGASVNSCTLIGARWDASGTGPPIKPRRSWWLQWRTAGSWTL